MTITWESAVSIAAIIAALIALYNYFAKAVRWMDKQAKQDEEIKKLREQHDSDIKEIKAEQGILVHGMLACLKCLAPQDVTGDVSSTINEIEKHLNKKAHE